MPNTFAYLALAAWPVVVMVFFALMPLQRAIVWSLLAATLFLPIQTSFDVKGLPGLDRESLPNIAVAGTLALLYGRLPRFAPDGPVLGVLLACILVGPVLSAMMNLAPRDLGLVVVPGNRPWDALSAFADYVIMLLPFFLARRFLATPEAHVEILTALAIAGVIYTVLIMFEARMSPQLNIWIYGFVPTEWTNVFRWFGYRPTLFMRNPLQVAFMMALMLGAAVAIMRLSPRASRSRACLIVLAIATGLFFCLTVSAMAFGAFLAVAIALLRPKRIIALAMILATITVTYPLTRSIDIFPTEQIVSLAKKVDRGRGGSLGYRFDAEDSVLDNLSGKELYGWGLGLRYRTLNEVGRNVYAIDGYWIIHYGMWGVIGFVGFFGIFLVPVFRLYWFARDRIPLATAALALMLSVRAVDLLVNNGVFSIHWLIAGALYGYAESLVRKDTAQQPARRPALRRSPGLAPEGVAAAGRDAEGDATATRKGPLIGRETLPRTTRVREERADLPAHEPTLGGRRKSEPARKPGSFRPLGRSS